MSNRIVSAWVLLALVSGLILGTFGFRTEVIQEVQVIVEKEVEVIREVDTPDADTFYTGISQGCLTGLFYVDLQLTDELTEQDEIAIINICVDVVAGALENRMFEDFILQGIGGTVNG